MNQFEQIKKQQLNPDQIMASHPVDELLSKPATNKDEAKKQSVDLSMVFGHINDWDNPAIYDIFLKIKEANKN